VLAIDNYPKFQFLLIKQLTNLTMIYQPIPTE